MYNCVYESYYDNAAFGNATHQALDRGACANVNQACIKCFLETAQRNRSIDPTQEIILGVAQDSMLKIVMTPIRRCRLSAWKSSQLTQNTIEAK